MYTVQYIIMTLFLQKIVAPFCCVYRALKGLDGVAAGQTVTASHLGLWDPSVPVTVQVAIHLCRSLYR